MTTSTTPPRPRRRPPPRPSPRTFWVRRAIALAVVLVALFLVVTVVGALAGAVFGGSNDDKATASKSPGDRSAGDDKKADDKEQPKAPPLPKATFLPGGGRTIFPARRVVAFYGNPADEELGALGIGTPDQAAAKLKRVAASYARKTRPILPCLELITTVAAAAPGADGKYHTQIPGKVIDRYLKAARKAGAILVLDVQPGRETFPREVRRLKKWLDQPDVGLALDPEWRLGPGQIPGQVIGSVDSSEVNQVSIDLAALIKERNLPEKLFVIHQFTNDMVRRKSLLKVRPGLATVFNVDGFGAPANKIGKYKSFVNNKPRGSHNGFKLFFKEDTDRMSPSAVMGLTPRPELVVYE